MKGGGNGRVVGTTKFRGDEYEDDGPATPEDIENDKKQYIQMLRSGQAAGLSKEQGWTFLELESPYITKVTNETAINYNRNHYYHVTGAGMIAKKISQITNMLGFIKAPESEAQIKDILKGDANATILQVLDKTITLGGRRSRNQRKSRRSRKQRNERKSRKQRRSRR